MKRTGSILTLLALIGSWANSQVFFHEDFQEAQINNYSVADLPEATWTLYNDDNTPIAIPDMSHFDQAWKIYQDETGCMMAASLSYFKKPGKADRWMVSKAIDLSQAEAPTLFFRAKALDAQNRDGFEVMVSTTGNRKEDFKTTLKSEKTARSSWTCYEIDLSPYKGQTLYLAFIQNSEDKYLIGIDDILIGEKAGNQALVTAVRTEANPIVESFPAQIGLTAEVLNTGDTPLNSYTLCYRINQGEIQKQETSGLEIAPGEMQQISLSLDIPSKGKQKVELYVENINQSGNSSPKTQVSFFCQTQSELPHKAAFLEIFSSGTCTSCVTWNTYLHSLLVRLNANTADNSDNLVAAKFQTEIPSPGDPFVTEETLDRTSYYNVLSAPSFFLSGKSFSPGYENYEKALKDSIASFRNQTVSLGLNASLYREGNLFRVESKVTAYLPDKNTYNLVVCLMEDSIHYFSGTPNGEKDFYYIVRKMLPSPMGKTLTPGEPGSSMENTFEYEFDLSDPKIFSSLDNLNAVIFLQNTGNREIIQAKYLKVGHIDHTSNLESSREGSRLEIYPNPGSDRVNIFLESAKAQKVQVRVFNLSGKEIHHFEWNIQEGENRTAMDVQDFPQGAYLVGIYGLQEVKVRKLIVK